MTEPSPSASMITANIRPPTARRSVGVGLVLVLGLLSWLVVLRGPGPESSWWVGLLALGGMSLHMVVLSASFRLVDRRRGEPTATFDLAIGSAISAAYQVATYMLARALWPELFVELENPPSWSFYVENLISAVFVLGLWTLAFRYPAILERQRDREIDSQRLRLLAEGAELQARLHPHFLLNTLNAVAGEVGRDPRRARAMLAQLGELIRATFSNQRGPEHSLATEVELLQAYAALLEVRYGEALTFTWELDRAALEVPVPRLLLQPLLENAVFHGALSNPHGQVTTAIRRDPAGSLVCLIIDNGLRDLDRPERIGGQGLDLVRRRLALRSSRASLALTRSQGRTTATVVLPHAA